MVEKKDMIDFLDSVSNSLGDAIVFVNKEGYIEMISDEYLQFLKKQRQDVVGRHVSQVIDNTRMHIIPQIREREIAELQSVGGQNIIATRAPLIFKGELIGAVGKVLFKDTEELNELYKKIMKMETEISRYKKAFNNDWARYDIDDIVTRNKRVLELKERLIKLAASRSNVLITGESGTGKELFAHAIYNSSKRRGQPFIRVNCSAIPSELLESELFGYDEGAFTGARKGGKIGKFEAADGGIIFLDEVGELPLNIQGKILRVLQENEIEKIGSMESKNIDVRVIAVTNRELEEMVDEGSFRMDLYYRLNVVNIDLPPLRERLDDIEPLSRSIIDKICISEEIPSKKIRSDSLAYLENYSWPGNIRELENVLERAINCLGQGRVIEPEHLPAKIRGQKEDYKVEDLGSKLEAVEREEISKALIFSSGNKAEAARLLGISRSSLYKKMEQYDIKNL